MDNHFSRVSLSHGNVPTPELSERFGDALNFAVALHRKHARKGTTIPYDGG